MDNFFESNKYFWYVFSKMKVLAFDQREIPKNIADNGSTIVLTQTTHFIYHPYLVYIIE